MEKTKEKDEDYINIGYYTIDDFINLVKKESIKNARISILI